MASFQPVRLDYNKYEPLREADENLAPIIFLHGLTGFKETWEEMPQFVANVTNRVSYSLDSRNHGKSEWSDHFNFDVNAEDLIHFMDTQGIKKAVIVGQSMGGVTAIQTALRWPDRVEKIVVEDMGVRRCPQEVIDMILLCLTQLRKALKEASPELDEDGVKKYLIKYMVANIAPKAEPLMAGKNMDPEANNRFLKFRRDANGRFDFICNMDVIEKSLRNTDTLQSEPEGQFDGPACFIYGKLSPFLVGADEHHIKQFFPNAILEGVEDAGHDVHNSKPLEFTDILLTFLK